MDGNGRWAKKRSLNRIRGHRAGTESVRDIVRASREFGIQVLTLYAFSTENWKRPAREVSALFELLKDFLRSELEEMMENGIHLNAIGDIERFPGDVLEVLRHAMDATKANQRMTLNLALSYGARDELARAARLLAQKCVNGKMCVEDITPEAISAHLYTVNLPDPDLLIRTGGEARLSNFLLWQLSYAEIFFTSVMWPDFRKEIFLQAILDFQQRERRFGRIGAQLIESPR